jgi:hypothetical protein
LFFTTDDGGYLTDRDSRRDRLKSFNKHTFNKKQINDQQGFKQTNLSKISKISKKKPNDSFDLQLDDVDIKCLETLLQTAKKETISLSTLKNLNTLAEKINKKIKQGNDVGITTHDYQSKFNTLDLARNLKNKKKRN